MVHSSDRERAMWALRGPGRYRALHVTHSQPRGGLTCRLPLLAGLEINLTPLSHPLLGQMGLSVLHGPDAQVSARGTVAAEQGRTGKKRWGLGRADKCGVAGYFLRLTIL